MHVRFHPGAQHELAEAAVWYEQRREGLGSELQHRVRDALKRIASISPHATLARAPRCARLPVEPLSLLAAVLPR